MTLVELLVAMVILGLVMTLVAQAVQQVSQIARVSQKATADLHGRWAAGWSVSNMLANMVAPPQITDTPVMTGTPTQVRGFSTVSLDGSGTGVSPFQLTLAPDDADPSPGRDRPSVLLHDKPVITTLFGDRLGPDQGKVVARFAERVEFVFVDRAGKMLSAWPVGKVAMAGGEVLPKAILVRSVASGRILMVYAYQGETIWQAPASKPFWEQQQ